MKLKFYRYNVNIEGFHYTVLIPEYTDGLFYTGKKDTWYGPFIESSIKTMPYLLASLAILSETNYIVFFNVRKNKRPSSIAYGDNAQYNIVLKNNSISISDKNLIKVLKNLKYYKRSVFKYDFDIHRLERKHRNKLKKIKDIPDSKLLCNSYGHCKSGFVIYSFGKTIYAREVIDHTNYFNGLIKGNRLSEFYDKRFDVYYSPFRKFVDHHRRKEKIRDSILPLVLNIGLYDISLVNSYVQGEKIYLVEKNEM